MNSTKILWIDPATVILASTVSPIGIVSSLLSICSLYKKVKTERNMFFIFMMLIAALDLLFNVFFMCVRLSDKTSWGHIIGYTLAFSISLAADLCALTLTIERCIALRWPHKQLSYGL